MEARRQESIAEERKWQLILVCGSGDNVVRFKTYLERRVRELQYPKMAPRFGLS